MPPCGSTQPHGACSRLGVYRDGLRRRPAGSRPLRGAWRCVQLHWTRLVGRGTGWLPCKGTGDVGCVVQTGVCSRSLCEQEVAGKEALSYVLLGTLHGGWEATFWWGAQRFPERAFPWGPGAAETAASLGTVVQFLLRPLDCPGLFWRQAQGSRAGGSLRGGEADTAFLLHLGLHGLTSPCLAGWM